MNTDTRSAASHHEVAGISFGKVLVQGHQQSIQFLSASHQSQAVLGHIHKVQVDICHQYYLGTATGDRRHTKVQGSIRLCRSAIGGHIVHLPILLVSRLAQVIGIEIASIHLHAISKQEHIHVSHHGLVVEVIGATGCNTNLFMFLRTEGQCHPNLLITHIGQRCKVVFGASCHRNARQEQYAQYAYPVFYHVVLLSQKLYHPPLRSSRKPRTLSLRSCRYRKHLQGYSRSHSCSVSALVRSRRFPCLWLL